jgi:hypothetical protein
VTRGACGCVKVVHSGDPLRLIHVQLIFKGAVEYPVFGLLIDLFLRMVRTQVTLAADLGLSRLFLAETVTSMTG